MRGSVRSTGRPATWAAVVAIVAGTALVLAGCGSSGDSTGSHSSSGSTEKPADTIDLGKVDGYTHFTYKVESVTTDAPCGMSNLPARNGRYIVVRMTVTAKKASPSARSPLLVGDWTGRTAAGEEVPVDYSRTMLCLPESQQFPTTLDKHGRASGSLVFDVSPKLTRLVDHLKFVQPPRKIVLDLKHPQKQTVDS